MHAYRRHTMDPDKDVRNDVVWAIQFHRPQEYSLETLVAIYRAGRHDRYHVARENAEIGLSHLAEGPIPSREVIESLLDDSDYAVRTMAQQWLKRSGDTRPASRP
jgi:hypothetical protein